MSVITRFAPSPTGMLHIGSARTALFNFLFARHHGGQYLLRIEDTDTARSTPDAVQAIFDGLSWLGITHNGEPVIQSHNIGRHREVALQMLERGTAYKCFLTPEELELAKGQSDKQHGFRSPWRDKTPASHPVGTPFVIRLKMPETGATTLHDLVQGNVTIHHDQLDDMILLRADGTPTYMHSVVVDDHDMKITHVIRGDDHLNNAFRQYHVYAAMGWDIPHFAHIPLIHGSDGAKLSKRHGAAGVMDYRAMGLLPEGLVNYLIRLGWSHGDDEIIPMDKAIEWFDLDHVGKAPSRLDFEKLYFVNAHYLRQKTDAELLHLMMPFLTEKLGHTPDARVTDYYLRAMPMLKERARTLIDLVNEGLFYTYTTAIARDAEATALLQKPDMAARVADVIAHLDAQKHWTHESLFDASKAFATHHGLKIGVVAQLIRALITGTTKGASIFHVLDILGREETLRRTRLPVP